MNCIKLRNKLLEITETLVDSKFVFQIEEINKLKEDFPHNIKLIDAMDSSRINYNCYAHTFDLVDSDEYLNWTLRKNDIYPNSLFCNYLYSNHLKRKNQKEIVKGDYIIYFNKGIPSHTGKIKNQQILSKWGTGHLWLHDIYEVPSSFGNDIEFCQQENKLKLQNFYKEWALEQ